LVALADALVSSIACSVYKLGVVPKSGDRTNAAVIRLITPPVLRRVMGYPAPQGTFGRSVLRGTNRRALPRSLIPNLLVTDIRHLRHRPAPRRATPGLVR
jgi:hypothetical protein